MKCSICGTRYSGGVRLDFSDGTTNTVDAIFVSGRKYELCQVHMRMIVLARMVMNAANGKRETIFLPE